MALTLEAAQKMVQVGVATAEGRGLRVSIAVVDSGGYVVAVGRMDKAAPLTPDIAHGKAAAAALFRRSGLEMQQRWAPGAPVPSAMIVRMGGRFVPTQGGLPIRVGEDVIGAIGFSGASSQEDEEIAQAALEAVKVSG
ncbi:MAG: heme-binding protein [Chloroflexi bacterium]|nr:heme-binding protein [Chloroflexota bacterium]